jgi:oligoribonuclease (3'-5' exoribonuclease)
LVDNGDNLDRAVRTRRLRFIKRTSPKVGWLFIVDGSRMVDVSRVVDVSRRWRKA